MAEVEFVDVTWMRVIKVWLSLVWRVLLFCSLSAAFIGFILSYLLELIRIKPEVVNAVCIIVGYIAFILVSIPVTKSILNKQYSDFKIALITE